MKLLFDENLSRKLVERLATLYPGSAHVASFDLLAQPDAEVWAFAQRNNFIVVTEFAANPDLGMRVLEQG